MQHQLGLNLRAALLLFYLQLSKLTESEFEKFLREMCVKECTTQQTMTEYDLQPRHNCKKATTKAKHKLASTWTMHELLLTHHHKQQHCPAVAKIIDYSVYKTVRATNAWKTTRV